MRYTLEQMEVAIKEWEQSGISKKAFCLLRGITYHTFHYWCKRLSAAADFAEVTYLARQTSGHRVDPLQSHPLPWLVSTIQIP